MTLAKTAETIELDHEPGLADDLLRLRGYLEQEDIEGARTFVKELEAKWPASERVHHYAQVLSPGPARVLAGQKSRSLERERAWLRANRHLYPGCWIALYGDQVIAADPDLSAVLAALHETPGSEDALLHLQPGEPNPS